MKEDTRPVTLLHIYGQDSWHAPAHIIGNRDGLEALKVAINAALYSLPAVKAEAKVYASDGEGYEVVVVCNNSDWLDDFWSHLRTPYTDNFLRDGRPERIEPEEAEAQI